MNQINPVNTAGEDMSEYTHEQWKAIAKAGGKELHPAEWDCYPNGVGVIPYSYGYYGNVENWQPDTDPGDCFRLLEAINKLGDLETCTGDSTEGTFWLTLYISSNEKYEAEAKTLMEAVCNLAIAIGSQNGRE